MTINELHNEIAKNEIYIFSTDSDKKAMCVCVRPTEAIGINYKKVKTDKEEKILLAEEYSHLKYELTYHLKNINSPCYSSCIEQAEYRAQCYATKLLVPYSELLNALHTGIQELWELADYFEVSEETISNAFNYYKTLDLDFNH